MNLVQLEAYFNSVDLPDSLRLNQCTVLNDVRKFIEINVSFLKSNSGKKAYIPYFLQLVELKKKLEQDEFIRTRQD